MHSKDSYSEYPIDFLRSEQQMVTIHRAVRLLHGIRADEVVVFQH